MTTQPLTPENTTVIIVAPDQNAIDHAKLQYGMPIDAPNVEPTLTVVRISTRAELLAYIATAPSPTLPWTAIPVGWGNLYDVYIWISNSMIGYFGSRQTLSSALRMINNEYAIQPKDLRG